MWTGRRLILSGGGSQKALSAPPGLTLVAVSEDAFAAMHQRKEPIRSFYANLLTFETYYEDQWFPYTMPVSDIMGLRQALENVASDPEHLKLSCGDCRCNKKSIDRCRSYVVSLKVVSLLP